MRGQQERTGSLFSYVSIEDRIPASHPLRRIRKLADQALDRLNPTICELYASEGRPSVPPEQLLLASLLQAFYGIRSERLLLEQLHYNLLFRWFVGLSPDDLIWHPTTFTKNRERLLNEQVMGRFLEKLMGAPEVKPLLSDEHFSVDGTLLQPGRPMPRWSVSMGRTIRPHRHQALARALVLQSSAGSGRKGISAASSSATRPIAPARILTRCCAVNPRPIQRYPATGVMC
jgi:transposase